MPRNIISTTRIQHPNGGTAVQVQVKPGRYVSHVVLYALDCPDEDTVAFYLGVDMGSAAYGIQYYVVTMDSRCDAVTRISVSDLPASVIRCQRDDRVFDVSWQPGYASETAAVEKPSVTA